MSDPQNIAKREINCCITANLDEIFKISCNLPHFVVVNKNVISNIMNVYFGITMTKAWRHYILEMVIWLKKRHFGLWYGYTEMNHSQKTFSVKISIVNHIIPSVTHCLPLVCEFSPIVTLWPAISTLMHIVVPNGKEVELWVHVWW